MNSLRVVFSFNYLVKSIREYRSELMAIAILGVLVNHLVIVGDYDQSLPIVKCVLLIKQLVYTQGFLLLSGFGLYFALQNNCEFRRFYKRRLARLWIPYVVMSSPFLIFQCISHHDSIWLLIGRLTTVSFWFEGNFCGMWYVAISMVLYFLFPLFYLLLFKDDKCVIVKTIILIILLEGAFVCLKFYFRDYYDMLSIGICKIPAFFIGGGLGYIAYNDVQLEKRDSLLLISFTVLWLFFSVMMKDSESLGIIYNLVSIPVCCIAFHFLSKSHTISRYFFIPLKTIGKYTLEIYVIHLMIIKTPELFPCFSPRQLAWFAIVVSLALSHPYSLLNKKAASFLLV